MKHIWRMHRDGLLNSYAQIFFARSRWYGLLLLAASMVNPLIGGCGLLAVLFTQALAHGLSLEKKYISEGWLGFNSAMLGMGMGAMFQFSFVFLIVLCAACGLALVIQMGLHGVLQKYHLPYMGLPFIGTMWCVLLAAPAFTSVLPAYTSEFYQSDYFQFINTANSWPVPQWLITFLRSLGAVFFQSNAFVGLLIATGLLVYSRISFLLALLGFLLAYGFYQLMGIDTRDLNEFYVGANYSFTAMALGGFFLIPNRSSFLLAVLMVPGVALVHYSAANALALLHVPAYTTAFTLSTLAVLYFLKWRHAPMHLHLVVQQFCSPEKNLRQYFITRENYRYSKFYPITLPFWGEWMVSQGHDGAITHLGEWSKAFDFVLLDEEMKTYANPGTMLEDFYCYNKPVLAPGDGYVSALLDGVEDNDVADVNTEKNWGNSIVIDHGGGLFSQISHLRKHSFKVYPGAYVKRGDVLGLCGNSGRSPEPHIHFQLQTTAEIGAKTLAYPVASFISREGDQFRLRIFETPKEGEFIRQVETHPWLRSAFDFVVGRKYQWVVGSKTEVWEVFTDAWNRSYIYCADSKSTAWFATDGVVFRFLDFKGDTDSLLYHFYLSGYKVFLGLYPQLEVDEQYPIAFRLHPVIDALQDFVLPFFTPVRADFHLTYREADGVNGEKILRLAARSESKAGGLVIKLMQAEMQIDATGTLHFTFTKGNQKTTAVCARS
ncbi:MAG: urea transporter [Chitinophagales bacterium]